MNAAEIRRWLAERVAREAGCSPDQVRADQPFSYYGLESAASAAIAGEVADLVGREVEATALFRFPTIEDLAAFLTTPQATEPQPGPGVRHQDGPGNRIGPGEPIAIVGIGARFPGADSPEAFWRSLTEGRDCISEQSGRWDTEADEPRQIRFGGFLDEIRGFDFDFFSLRKDEAIHMDPQQRLLLETSWEALEDAGRRPSQLRGSRTGVFVGISTAEYGWRQVHAASEGLHATAPTGNSLAVAANRISYFYDLRGPSVAVDTACSSSLVALHLAASSLRSGDCDQLLVCGVNLLIEPAVSTGLARAGMLAQDGRCRTFDAAASGYVRGEGCGAVVLAPLSVAVARGDRIYALLLGSAVNQDGRSNGLTAPNPAAQEAVLRAAHDNAGIAAHEVQYVECHGTGTLLGDPIEAGALGKVVGVGRPSPCLIGSVKTNIGHLESAAGIAGLIKTALALFHGEIPASLHFREPNPHIDFEELGLRVADASMPWPECDRRVAGLSSFGFGGANAHAVLAAAPQAAPGPSAGQPDVLLLPVSARSAPALSATASQWADFVESLDGDTLTDAVATAALRRDHHPVRAAVTGRSAAELARGLRAVGGATHRSPGRTMPGRVGFVFSGQGGQWPAMARRLLATSQIFASTIRACDEVTTREAGFAVSALLADDALGGSQDTAVAQPVLFAVQAGLTAIWRSYRVWPSAVIGHSVGEIAAAYAAGSLSLAEGAELACRRGSAMASTRGHGRMLVTDLDEGSASELLPGAGEITIAAVNSPRATVFAGQESDLARMHDDLIARSRFASWLPVPYAFHSAQMDEAADTLSRQLADLTTAAPAVPMYSTVTGKLRGEPFSASYWARNIRDTVRFADAMASMLSDGIDILLEIGPHPVLARSIGEVAAHLNLAVTQVGSLRREQDDQVALLTAAGELYRGGIDLDWRRIVPPGRLITAPTYPWQRTRCWLDRPSPVTPVPRGAHPMLGRRVDLAASADAHVFTAEIDLGRLPFLADHRVRGTAVLPATAYVELAVAAARAAGMTGPIEVAEFSFDSFLDLSQAPRVVQTTLRRKDTDTWLLTVHSRARDSGSTWDLHAHGELRACGDPGSADPAQIRERCVDHYGAERLYAALAELGLDYGPAFRAVVDVWTGRDEAIGDLRDGQPGYECDPAVLDGALHLVAAVGPPGPGLRVPVGIDLVRVAGRPVLATQARASTCAADRADVTLLADDGSVLVELSGVRFAAATAEEPPAVQGGVWGYDILWRASDLVTLPGSADRRWLVLADDGPVGKTLADRIRKEGGNAELVERSGLDRLGQILESGVETVIDLRPLDAHQGQPPDSAMDHAVKAVELIRQLSLSGGARTPELWFVTRGAQPVGERACSDPVGAPIWGLSKVVPFENPALRCRMIDLDSVVADSAVELINSAVELIISEAQSPGRDTEIGFAAGDLSVGSFLRLPAATTRRSRYGLKLRISSLADLARSAGRWRPGWPGRARPAWRFSGAIIQDRVPSA